MFGVHTPTTVPVLSVGASSTSTSKIAVAEDSLESNDALSFTVMGRAFSANTKVGMETRFFNTAGAIVGTHTDMLHTGGAGLFSVNKIKTNLPASAASWKARLVVKDGPATFNVVAADCMSCRIDTGGYHPDGGSSCEDCSKDCGDYTALGQECDGNPCTAECNGVFGDDLLFEAGVDPNP